MNAGTFIYVGGNARIATTMALPTNFAPNAVPFSGVGAISVAGAGPAGPRVSGLMYSPVGRLCIDMTGAAIVSRHAGLAFTAAGRLCCDTSGAIAGYVRGIPVTASGRVCIDVPTPAPADEEADEDA